MKKKRGVTLGLIQMSISEDPDRNLSRAAEKIREAAENGAQIICLPELYRTRYFPQKRGVQSTILAETIPGISTQTFSVLAKELSVVLIIPVFEKARNGKFYNSAVVIDRDGRLQDTYRKVHLPHDPGFYEQDYFVPGDLGFRLFKTRYADFSVLICYDQWFPEAARTCTLLGADILFYPTAIGTFLDSPDPEWHEAWETVQRGHAIANGVHVCSVNRVGIEGALNFWGGSFLCDSFGTVLGRAGSEEEILVLSVDLDRNREIREGWGFLKNRRPEMYGRLIGPGKQK